MTKYGKETIETVTSHLGYLAPMSEANKYHFPGFPGGKQPKKAKGTHL